MEAVEGRRQGRGRAGTGDEELVRVGGLHRQGEAIRRQARQALGAVLVRGAGSTTRRAIGLLAQSDGSRQQVCSRRSDGAVLRGPPVVEWAKVPKARFYNLQLWRGRQKLLTTWLKATKLKLAPAWSYQGKRQRLVIGGYIAFVWPAFGTTQRAEVRQAARSGALRREALSRLARTGGRPECRS